MQAAGIAGRCWFRPPRPRPETDFLLDIAARTDFVAGVVGWLDMRADDFPARLDHYIGRPKWVGLRPMLQRPRPAEIADPRFRRAHWPRSRRGVPFDILTFSRHLPAMVDALHATPGLHAILDHISKPDMTRPIAPDWAAGIRRWPRCRGCIARSRDW